MPTLVTPRPTRRRLTKRQRSIRLVLAILGSLLLHGLILLAVVWIVPHWPRGRVRRKSQPIELTVLPSTPPAREAAGPVDAQGTPPPYIRTLDHQASKEKPDDPAFQSDKDTQAASALAANGNKPMPTTEGKVVPYFDFEPRPFRLGDKAADAATSAASAQAELPPAPVNTPPPTPPPVNKKPPLPAKNRPQRKPSAQPTPATGDLAQPKADAAASPEPAAPTPMTTPTDDENVPPPPPLRSGRQPQTAATANSTVTSNGAPKPPGYQPQSQATKMSGSINNRGRNAVAAIGTPLGRYQKAVDDAVGMLWYYKSAQAAADLSPGTVKIHFYVTRDGRIRDVKFIGGNPNGSLGLISEQSIMEAQIEPIPSEVATLLPDGQLEGEISFIVE